MGIFDKLFNKPKVDRYYQVGIINPNLPKNGGSYKLRYDRNMTFKKSVPFENAKKKYIECNQDIINSEYEEGLDIDKCIKIITIDNVQIHPRYKHKWNIVNNDGYILLKMKKEYR